MTFISLSIFTTIPFGIICGSVSNNPEVGKRLYWRSTVGLYAFIQWISGNIKFCWKHLTMRGALWELSFFEGHSKFWKNLILPIKLSIDQVLCQQWYILCSFIFQSRLWLWVFLGLNPERQHWARGPVIICS